MNFVEERSHPEEGSAEWWDAVARSHWRIVESPPKFINPLMPIAKHIELAEAAEKKAASLRAPLEFATPTKEVEESISRAENGRAYGLKHIESHQTLDSIKAVYEEPKVIVTAQDWQTVFGLD